MTDISEIVVRATPAGIDETAGEMDELEDSIEGSTDEMDEQASALSGLSKRFSGAMGAIMAGFAVATAGLLSQVPVVGELMSGLGAILEGIAFRIDSQLRPVLQPLTDALFGIADSIFEADGAWGKLLDGLILGIAIFGTIVGVAKLVALAIGVIGAVLASPILLIGLLTALLIGLAVVFYDEIIAAISDTIDWFKDLGSSIKDFVSDAWSRITDFIDDVVDGFTDLVDDAVDWGEGLLGNLLESFKEKVEDVLDWVSGFVSDISDEFTDLVSDAFEWGKDLIQRFISGIKDVAGNVGDVVGGIELAGGVTVGDVAGSASGAASNAASGAGDFIGSVGGGGGGTYLDGRRVDDNQGRFRKDSLTRRGG